MYRPIDSATQPLMVIDSGASPAWRALDDGCCCAERLTIDAKRKVAVVGKCAWVMPPEEQDRSHSLQMMRSSRQSAKHTRASIFIHAASPQTMRHCRCVAR